ncbi:DUF6427 family protein [Mangrovimonas sp. AS39]|uniref:DUF6427 family protein n=1 Tax=Mangrovimonas futianensis TaxID=2895523 RepID=UPI001E58BC86|nr:DUF6427 family protein [Mangrovimonas futianensis]MCF1190306.1 DUF6427 family protein [Mangrovimonas futianensis]MCF1193941.1 DUF6427 family protein [Mangrovimonas futianensis]MCF1420938.1 DUF6427 family protein [Mangrovimonas futianensis]
MIANFFSKSKPIHLVIISLVLLVAFVISKLFLTNIPFGFLEFFKQAGIFGVVLVTVFVFDFVTSKNKLTKKNSFRVLFFTLFMTMIPQTFLDTNLIFANLFVMFALRRIVSLRTQKEVKKKLFDAAIWISVATLFYFWSGLFFILIFAALFLFRIVNIKDWFIPVLGMLTIAMIAAGFMIIFQINLSEYLWSMPYQISLDFSTLNKPQIITSATIIIAYFIWSLFYYVRNIKSKSKSYKPSFILILIATIISVLILIISPNKTGAEFIFLFVPLSIILTNYFEIINEKWFQEVLVWILLLTPVVGLIL